MALTPYYGLSYFGGNTAGALTDDGAKFTGADRIQLDRILHALATSHRHLREYQSISDPNAPTAVVGDDGGLPAGATYYYVVTYVDADGLESLPSEEVQVTLPVAIPPPDAPTLADQDSGGTPYGGSLTPGLYFYALTAFDGVEETILGPQVSITLVDDTSGVHITLPDPPATGVDAQAWRMKAGDVGWTRLGTVAFTTGGTIVDDGSIPTNLNSDDPSQAPPATNSGQDIYSVTLTLNTADQVLATDFAITAWRIYRTETSGAWPAASLVHQVVETTDPSGANSTAYPLVVSYRDDGDILLDGIPPTTSTGVTLTPYVLDHVTSLPSPTDYPEFYPLLYDGALYVKIGSAWVALGGGGSGVTQLLAQETAGQTTPMLLLKDDAGTTRFSVAAAPDLPGDEGGWSDLWLLSRNHSNYINLSMSNVQGYVDVGSYAPGGGRIATALLYAGGENTQLYLYAEPTQASPLATFQVDGTTVFEIGIDGAVRLRSPDGTLHTLTMSNAGVLGVSGGTPRGFASDVGAMTAGVGLAIAHGLGTDDLVVMVRNKTSGAMVLMDTVVDATNITLTSAVAVSSATLRVTAIPAV